MHQTAIVSPSKQGNDAAQALLLQGWIQWAGPPKLLCVDAATELNSQAFAAFLQKYSICHRTARLRHTSRMHGPSDMGESCK